jgi:hypothetical protein
MSGARLAPRSQWGEETGEADGLHVASRDGHACAEKRRWPGNGRSRLKVTLRVTHQAKELSTMGVETETITLPAYWAAYLINGDASYLTDREERLIDCRMRPYEEAGWHVSGVSDDEPRFTWRYRLHGGDAEGGDDDAITRVVGEDSEAA